MPNVLVTYASKQGSTAEIAEAIAGTMREAGLGVDCISAGDVDSLAPYDAVVLGSAVYIKRWRREARRFLGKHDEELSRLPFWIFSSGPVGEPTADSAGWVEPRRIVEKAERLGLRGHMVFGGRVPAEPHGPVQRAMVENTPAEFRDRRDWDEIRGWAAEVASELRQAVPAG